MSFGTDVREEDGKDAWHVAKLQAALIRILVGLGVSAAGTAALLRRWHADGSSFQAALLAGGTVEEGAYFDALAREAGYRFLDRIEPGRLLPFRSSLVAALGTRDCNRIVFYAHPDGNFRVLVSPDLTQIPSLVAFRNRNPAFAKRIRFVPPGLLREQLFQATRAEMTRLATGRLFVARPDLSARRTGAIWQGLLSGLSLMLLPYGLWIHPSATQLFFHLLAALFFLSCIILRLLAVSAAKTGMPVRSVPAAPEMDMPVYSVVVALYREANIVGDLLVALGRLRWPRSRLEIKLVCEADDHETIEAIRAHRLAGSVEIIAVPPGLPRTKPKAITYALPALTGEFLVLYDAEDRPHPDQLLEAWHRFRTSDGNLACLQAPLVISNWRTNFLTRMFAFEYAALFRGLLPWLSRNALFFPLGGTSNHFRRSAIEHVGGWDPYNMTEDADLGIRLMRFGYRSEVITCPTLEDAPENMAAWHPQRTRWMKGWLQCLMVHNRHPRRLARELGRKNFLVVQIVFAGVVFSSLLHPLLVVYILGALAKVFYFGDWEALSIFLFTLDMTNLVIAYVAFYRLGRSALSDAERDMLPGALFQIPVYWLLISRSAWRAVRQLIHAPHLWEKTPHKRARRTVPLSRRASTDPRR